MGVDEKLHIIVTYDDEGRIAIRGVQDSPDQHAGTGGDPTVAFVDPLFGSCPPMDPNTIEKCPPMSVTIELGWNRRKQLELTDLRLGVGRRSTDPHRRATDPQP